MVLSIFAPGVEMHQYLAMPHWLYFWLLAWSRPDTASQWPSSAGSKYGKAERTLALAYPLLPALNTLITPARATSAAASSQVPWLKCCA